MNVGMSVRVSMRMSWGWVYGVGDGCRVLKVVEFGCLTKKLKIYQTIRKCLDKYWVVLYVSNKCIK